VGVENRWIDANKVQSFNQTTQVNFREHLLENKTTKVKTYLKKFGQ